MKRLKDEQVENGSGANEKKKPLVPLSALVLYLTLITIALTGVTLAKYVSTAVGTGTLQVAAFKVAATSTIQSYDTALLMEVGPDKTATFDITIDNSGSEVSVLCDIELVSVGGLPLVFSVKDANGVTKTVTDGRFINDLEIGYEESEIYTVTVTWNSEQLDYRYSYELDYIDIFVDVVQAD